jgi:hypothetical protein
MVYLRRMLIAFVLVFLLPIAASAALWYAGDPGTDWRSRDRSSAGLLPDPAVHRAAVVRIFAARTVRWRGIFSVHSWIVVKAEGARTYTRWDYTAWGDPIRINGFAADGRWFGDTPTVVFAADGAEAAVLVPKIEAAVRAYPFAARGDYRAWPGPNSNTFVAAVIDAVPEMRAVLPPNAVGRDYPHDGRWVSTTPSGTGLRLRLGGYAGLTVAWVEGLEVNLLGAVAGLDLERPGLKLPGLGRLGLPPRAE